MLMLNLDKVEMIKMHYLRPQSFGIVLHVHLTLENIKGNCINIGHGQSFHAEKLLPKN